MNIFNGNIFVFYVMLTYSFLWLFLVNKYFNCLVFILNAVGIDRYKPYERKLFEVLSDFRDQTVTDLWDQAHLYIGGLVTVSARLHGHNEGDLCFLETGPEHEGVKMRSQLCGIKLFWRSVLDGNSFISGREKNTDIAFCLGYAGWKCSHI